MNYYILVNSPDGFIIESVNGKKVNYANAFYYKRTSYGKSYYVLVDIQSGLAICSSVALKNLEAMFHEVAEQKYLSFIKTDAYKNKVDKFHALVKVHERGNA